MFAFLLFFVIAFTAKASERTMVDLGRTTPKAPISTISELSDKKALGLFHSCYAGREVVFIATYDERKDFLSFQGSPRHLYDSAGVPLLCDEPHMHTYQILPTKVAFWGGKKGASFQEVCIRGNRALLPPEGTSREWNVLQPKPDGTC